MVNNDKNLSRRVRMQKEKNEKALAKVQDKRLQSEDYHRYGQYRPSMSLQECHEESKRARSAAFNVKRLRDKKAEEMQIEVGLHMQAALPLVNDEPKKDGEHG